MAGPEGQDRAARLEPRSAPARPEPPRRRRRLRTIVRVVLCLGLLEAVLALPGPARFLDRVRDRTFQVEAADVETLTLQTINFDAATGRPLMLHDPELFWRMDRDVDLHTFMTEVRTDGRGLRSAPFSDAPEDHEERLLFLGDSVTFGFRVAENARFSDVLAARLSDLAPERRFAVVNAGVPGYSSYQGLTWLRAQLDRVAPSLVVVGFGVNDALRRRTLSDEQFAARSHALGARVRHGLRHSRLVCLAELGLAGLRREIDVARGTPRRAVARWLAYPRAPADGDKQQRCTVEQTLRHLDAMAALCDERGVPLVVLTTWTSAEVPSRSLPSDRYFTDLEAHMQATRSWCADHAVPLADADAAFTERDEPPETLLFDFCHPRENGHALVAETLFDTLVEADLVDVLTR